MASAPSIELKRHYRQLSAKETDGVVDVMADLIVSFLKARSEQVAPMHGSQSGTEDARHKAQPSTRNKR